MDPSLPMDLAPLLSLLALGFAVLVQTALVAFFGGKMSQRMTSAEKRLGEQDVKIDTKLGDQTALIRAVALLEGEMAHSNKTLDKVSAQMEGVHRQLGNIAMNRIGAGGEMS